MQPLVDHIRNEIQPAGYDVHSFELGATDNLEHVHPADLTINPEVDSHIADYGQWHH